MPIISLTINGKKKRAVVSQDTVLLDLLSDHLHLTGTKQSCDCKGQC